MRAWVAVALFAGLLAGCAGPGPAGCDDGSRDADPASLRTPWVEGAYLRTDARTTWDTVVLASGTDDLSPWAGPSGWTVETDTLSSPDDDAGFTVLRVAPGPGMGSLDLPYSFEDCQGVQSGTIRWDLMEPVAGKSASPGQGVHVYTAGFWENGTLFYTNIKEIDHDGWPRAGWYAWEGGDPLPVYVYDQDRSEQPLVWQDPTMPTPLHGEVEGLGYFTTIPGFNEALKGLSTNTVRVVRLAPEEAYTHAGNEDHPLYGDAIVFYIKVVDVVDLPCPMQVSRVCGFASMDRNDRSAWAELPPAG